MGDVIYSMSVSLDGFIAGPGDDIEWGAPSEELHRFHNERCRELEAHLLGRKLYEVMLYWERVDESSDVSDYEIEFAEIWNPMPKVVFSRTLESVEGNATLASDDVAAEVRRLKEQHSGAIGLGGAGLASSLEQLGLIDEYWLFFYPVILGEGTPFFSLPHERVDLELVDTRRFDPGVVSLHYAKR